MLPAAILRERNQTYSIFHWDRPATTLKSNRFASMPSSTGYCEKGARTRFRKAERSSGRTHAHLTPAARRTRIQHQALEVKPLLPIRTSGQARLTSVTAVGGKVHGAQSRVAAKLPCPFPCIGFQYSRSHCRTPTACLFRLHYRESDRFGVC